MTETFRGGILAVSHGEIEAALAFGMPSWKVFLRITLPLMVRHALPGFGNNWMVLGVLLIRGIAEHIEKSLLSWVAGWASGVNFLTMKNAVEQRRPCGIVR